MSSVYSHIDRNKRNTVLVVTIFIIMVCFISWFIGEYYYEEGLFFVGVGFVFSGVSSLISYYNSDKIVLAISGAKEASEDVFGELYDLVENMCIASGIKSKPKIYIINDSAPNAFATGRNPENSVICFTTGIMYKLDKRELEGVIAHELSHIQNYDILLMSIVSVLVGTVTLIADFFTRGVFYGRRRRSGSGGGLIVVIGLFFVIISPIVATLIKLAISRSREFLADASAVMLTRYPQGLSDALLKIASDREALEAANGATAHLYISNPLKNNKGNFFAKMFNTHPPVEERVERLMRM